jgi:predicted kinase
MQPTLIVVTGPPCSGKSTLARRLALRYGLPSFEKDVAKEALFESVGVGDREWSRKLSDASFAVVIAFAARSLSAGGSAIVEGNFRDTHAPRLEQLRVEFDAKLIQIACGGDGRTITDRFLSRLQAAERHAGHLDRATLEELRPQLARGFDQSLAIEGPRLAFDSTADPERQVAALYRALDAELAAPGPVVLR